MHNEGYSIALLARKIKNFEPVFLDTLFFFESYVMSLESRLKGFNMIYHSAQSDNYLWYLILRVKKNRRTNLYTKFLSEGSKRFLSNYTIKHVLNVKIVLMFLKYLFLLIYEISDIVK